MSKLDLGMACPSCDTTLEYCSGQEGIPEHLYCPNCMDWGYDPETGEELFQLE